MEKLKVPLFYIVVTRDRYQNGWGEYYQARLSLSKNNSQRDGISSTPDACILLERDNDGDFVCVLIIYVERDFRTTMATLFSAGDPHGPVYLDVSSPPFIVGRVK